MTNLHEMALQQRDMLIKNNRKQKQAKYIACLKNIDTTFTGTLWECDKWLNEYWWDKDEGGYLFVVEERGLHVIKEYV